MSPPADPKRDKRIEVLRGVARERLERLNLSWIQWESGAAEAAQAFRRELHTLKGEASLTGFALASRVVHRIEDLVQAAATAGAAPDAALGDRVLRGLDLVTALIEGEPEQASPDAEAFLGEGEAPAGGAAPPIPTAEPELAPDGAAAGAPGRSADNVVRVDAQKLDRLRDMVAELLLVRVRLLRSSTELRRTREAAGELRERLDLGAALAGGQAREWSLLVETLSALEGQLRDESHQVTRLVSELDGTTRDLRLVPLRQLLDRYPVAVRTLARQLGRQVRLRTEGEDIEVDRSVLEVLDEPLLHIVRNALDHGIESPEERVAAGKPAEATLALRAALHGQTVALEVSDDGRGIDVDAVRRRAVALGLADAAAASALPESAVLRLLFAAGLSTRDEVTETSGRGIGLNVVLANIEALGGDVEISTVPGRGTTFLLTAPVTVAITSALLFRVGVGRYALPSAAVRAVVDAAAHAPLDSAGGPVIRFEERLVPLVHLGEALGEAAAAARDRGKQGRVIIAQSGEDLVALGGSEQHVEREVVMKPLGRFFEHERTVSAAVHLEDGALALVLKAGELALLARGAGTVPRRPTAMASRTGIGRTVLCADDSPVVRDLIAEALRAHGIHVIEASDGQEALLELGRNAHIDLVVTDVEMPRLDGIGLIRALRAAGGARRIPAVVVSMRGSETDKRLALDAGADAYLVKSDFSHAGLWSMIARFLE